MLRRTLFKGLAAAAMSFTDPIVGGESNLVRTAIQSPNFVPGTSGWIIRKDGSFEFGPGGTFRGDVIVRGANGASVEITTASLAKIALDPPTMATSGLEAVAGTIYARQNDDVNSRAFITMASPTPTLGAAFGEQAVLSLTSGSITGDIAPSMTLDSPASFYCQDALIGNTLQIGGSLTDFNGMTYLKGQRGTETYSFAAATSNGHAVVFPASFNTGEIPMVSLNINDSSAQTLRWTVKAHSVTENGFTILAANPIGAAANAWTNIPIQWSAVVPG